MPIVACAMRTNQITKPAPRSTNQITKPAPRSVRRAHESEHARRRRPANLCRCGCESQGIRKMRTCNLRKRVLVTGGAGFLGSHPADRQPVGGLNSSPCRATTRCSVSPTSSWLVECLNGSRSSRSTRDWPQRWSIFEATRSDEHRMAQYRPRNGAGLLQVPHSRLTSIPSRIHCDSLIGLHPACRYTLWK